MKEQGLTVNYGRSPTKELSSSDTPSGSYVRGELNHGDSKSSPAKERFHLNGMAVLTEDMPGFVGHTLDSIFGNTLTKDVREEAIATARNSFETYLEIVQQAFPGREYPLREGSVNGILRTYIASALEKNPDTIFAVNDRYIGQGLEDEFSGHIFRWQSTRIPGTIDNNSGDRPSIVGPRPGEPSSEQQLDNIEEALRAQNKTLNGANVVFVDDCTATNGTEKNATNLFTARGATVDRTQSIYSYVIFINGYNPSNDRKNSGGISEERVGSIEQRELGPLGGPVVKVGKYVALQQPTQAPWSNGVITRMDGLICRPELERQQMETFIEVFGAIESLVKGEIRNDGSTFEYFSFADFRQMIPTSRSFGPSAAIRDYIEKHGEAPKGLHDLSMLEYVRLALRENEKRNNKPPISLVAQDLDGTVLKLRYSDPTKRDFSNSALAEPVKKGFSDLIEQFTIDLPQADDAFEGMDIEKPLQLIKQNPVFTTFLEQEYGEYAVEQLKKRFSSFYGEGKAQEELKRFLAEYNFLPLAYHVIREFTWGRIDFNEAYELDQGKAKEFSQRIIKNGAEIIFVTASPRIHAMRMLEATRQADLVIANTAILITVEDLYDPKTKEELPKDIVLSRVIYPGVTRTDLTEYVRGKAMDGKVNTQANALPPQLEERLKGRQKVHPTYILAVGDQPHSDARAGIRIGGYGHVVDGPDKLVDIFNHIDISNPPIRHIKRGISRTV